MISKMIFARKNTPLTPLKGGIRCANLLSLTRMPPNPLKGGIVVCSDFSNALLILL